MSRDIMEKLSIGIISLALICPLTLGSMQSIDNVHAKSVGTTVIKKHKKYRMNYSKINKSIKHEQSILNSKTGRYYLNIYRNLIKQEKFLHGHRDHNKKIVKKGKFSHMFPFKFVGLKKKLNVYNKYFNKRRLAVVAPGHNVKVTEMSRNPKQSSVDEKPLRLVVLKPGTRVRISRSSNGWIINGSKSNSGKSNYFIYSPK